jgi:hypothetical protein
MRFRKYCVIILKNTEKAIEEIDKICEGVPNILNGGGMIIATFISALEPKEINDWFISNERNFLFFELNPDSSGYNIINEKLNTALFGFLKNDDLDLKRDNFLREINLSSATTNNVVRAVNVKKITKPKVEVKITATDIADMGEVEKRKLFDKILDNANQNGVIKLSNYDKKLLQLLAK